jgi:hypothetical protein
VEDEGREDLLQHVAVFAQQEAEEFGGVVGDEVDFEPVAQFGPLDRFGSRPESDHLP